MPDQKIENLLNLAMNALPQERAKSENLNVGYDPTTRLWDVIVKYSGPDPGGPAAWWLCSSDTAGIGNFCILSQRADRVYRKAQETLL